MELKRKKGRMQFDWKHLWHSISCHIKDGKYLISGSEDKSIKFWNLEEKLDEHSLYGHTSNVYTIAISQDAKYLASGSNDKSIIIWNLNDKREEFTLTGHTSYIYAVAIHSKRVWWLNDSDMKHSLKNWSLHSDRTHFFCVHNRDK